MYLLIFTQIYTSPVVLPLFIVFNNMNTKITALGDIQTNLGNVIGLIPDHHNKAGIIIKKIKV